MPTKRLDSVIYYEKYVVVQPGALEGRKDAEGIEINGSHKMDFLSEEEYIDIIENKLDPHNEYLDDSDPNKFIAKMGAEAIYDLCLQSISTHFLTNCAIVPTTTLRSSARPRRSNACR